MRVLCEGTSMFSMPDEAFLQGLQYDAGAAVTILGMFQQHRTCRMIDSTPWDIRDGQRVHFLHMNVCQ